MLFHGRTFIHPQRFKGAMSCGNLFRNITAEESCCTSGSERVIGFSRKACFSTHLSHHTSKLILTNWAGFVPGSILVHRRLGFRPAIEHVFFKCILWEPFQVKIKQVDKTYWKILGYSKAWNTFIFCIQLG